MPGGGGCSGRKTSGERRKADSSSRAVEDQARVRAGAGGTAGGERRRADRSSGGGENRGSGRSGAGATAGGRVERLVDGVHQLAARRRFEQIPDRPQTLPDLPGLPAGAPPP